MVFWGYWLLPCHPFSRLLMLWRWSWGPDDWYIPDARVISCAFTRRTQTSPLSEQQEVLFPSHFGAFVLLSQGGGGGGVRSGGIVTSRWSLQTWWWLLHVLCARDCVAVRAAASWPVRLVLRHFRCVMCAAPGACLMTLIHMHPPSTALPGPARSCLRRS